MHPIRTARSYVQAIPTIIVFQTVTSIVLALCYALLKWVATWALRSQGRVAVTTGDFLFLFTTWQGILLLVLALVTLYLAVSFDLNVKVAFAGRWVRGEDVGLRNLFSDATQAVRRFLCPSGFLVVLYIVLLTPLLGVGVSISLTENLTIPTFISSVIEATPLYKAAYTVVVIVFSLVGFLGIFVMQGVVLDGLSVRDALRQSFRLIRAHWLDYLLQMLLFAVLVALVLILVAAVVIAVGTAAANSLVTGGAKWAEFFSDQEFARFLLLLVTFITIIIVAFIVLLGTPFLTIKMTKLYLTYATGEPVDVPKHPHRIGSAVLMITLVLLALAVAVAGSFVLAKNFDEAFPKTSGVRVVAHRACGNEGPENTAVGIDIADQADAWGAEIDIQRTADGAYVVNHDNTFKRVAGDGRKPSEMTLDEVRQLLVRANPADPNAPGEPVATYEEMLDASRDKVKLFVELKGETADHQMADDAVRIARERNMLDQCVFISLNYELIDYLETTYPDAQTGFLLFASYGDTASLNCDYLALEELSATSDAIDAVHEQGKQVLVWTVNDDDSQHRFMCSDADAIITDNITQAEEVRTEVSERSDFERVWDGFASIL